MVDDVIICLDKVSNELKGLGNMEALESLLLEMGEGAMTRHVKRYLRV